MQKSNREEFEEIVNEGIKAIPEKFLQKLKNVEIVIEDEPTLVQRKKFHPVRSNLSEANAGLQADRTSNGVNLHPGWTLFGLYEGVPQLERGAGYNAVLPDKITIFQNPIEAAANNEQDIKEMVKNTVWHEIAHHFGMNEARVRQAEARRKK